MQIVIDIDEDTYRYMQSRLKYQNKDDKGLSKFEEAGVAIKNGIPLPKGHGRLIDADALEGHRQIQIVSCGNGKYVEIMTYYQNDIDVAHTIIEADGGGAE